MNKRKLERELHYMEQRRNEYGPGRGVISRDKSEPKAKEEKQAPRRTSWLVRGGKRDN